MDRGFNIERKPVRSGLIISICGLVGSFFALIGAILIGVDVSSSYVVIATLIGLMSIIMGTALLSFGFVVGVISEMARSLKGTFKKVPKYEKWKELFTEETDEHIKRIAESVRGDNFDEDLVISLIDDHDFSYQIDNAISDYDFSYDVSRELDNQDFSQYFPEVSEDSIKDIEERVEVSKNTIANVQEQIKDLEDKNRDLDNKFRQLRDETDFELDQLGKDFENKFPTLLENMKELEADWQEVLKELKANDEQDQLEIEKEQESVELINFKRNMKQSEQRNKFSEQKKTLFAQRRMKAVTDNPIAQEVVSSQYFHEDGSPKMKLFGEITTMVCDQK